MSSNKLLVQGGRAIVGDNGNLRVQDSVDILISDGRIAAVENSIQDENARVIDARGMLVIPGLVDTHRHAWHTLMRGLCSDGTILQYTRTLQLEYGAAHSAEDVRLATLVGALEAIDTGVTTLGDHAHTIRSPEHAEGALAGLHEAGIRGIYFHSLYDAPAVPRVFPDHSARVAHARDFHKRHFRQPGLIRFGLALNEPKEIEDAIFQTEIDLAHELGAKVSAHIGNMSGAGRITRLNSLGLLGPHMLLIHCNVATDDEFQMIADSGSAVSITPESEFALGLGTPVTGRCLARGIRPGIGLDMVPFCSGDLLEQVRIAVGFQRFLNNQAILERGRIPATVSPTALDGFRFATIDGARALGLDKEIGSIAPGKQADIVLMSQSHLNHIPPAEPFAAIIFQSRPHDIDTVIIGGRIRKQSGRLLDADLAALRDKASAAQKSIVDRAKTMAPLNAPAVAAFARLRALAE